MEIIQHEQVLRIRGIRALSGGHAHSIRDTICAALTPDIETIEMDLSETSQVDGCGLGALVALYKASNYGRLTLRLLHPQPAVQQVIELTRLHHLFEVVPRESIPAPAPLTALKPIVPQAQSAPAL